MMRLVSGADTRRIIPYREAASIVATLGDDLLPGELTAVPLSEREARWAEWVAMRDARVRSRLDRGDEDSVVNLFWFGTSFTTQSRLTPDRMLVLGREGADAIYRARLADLVTGILAPGGNERLQFARTVLERAGTAVTGPSAGRHVREQLERLISRSLEDLAAYQTASFQQQSTLFRNRGLASDTSTFGHFAIEEALRAAAADKLLGPGSVRRVAIVGPGLDFADKDAGYDFYPPQTIQPFAVVDAVLHLGLAKETPQVTTFDVSAEVNRHLERAVARARAGHSYVMQLSRPGNLRWDTHLLEYWKQFGRRIARDVPALPPPPAVGVVHTQAVGVRPEVVKRLTPMDLNIVFQRLELPEAERFDLIVATNVLVYYGLFEQSLALANIASMLRPGGVFISNDYVQPTPSVPMTVVGETRVNYLADQAGDAVVRYRRR